MNKVKKVVKVPTSKEGVARVMRAVALQHDGEILKGSYVGNLQRALAKREAKRKKEKGGT